MNRKPGNGSIALGATPMMPTIPSNWQHWSISSVDNIRPIKGASPNDRFGAVELTGIALRSIGIHHADMLIFRVTEKYEENCIGIWQTPIGRLAKFAIFNEEQGTVKLHNRNGSSVTFQEDQVTLLGLAVRVERELGPHLFP